ncbi:MAG: MinD/ParA family protein [Calditrichaeota bacterium]|nr:MAG: MinD/ParA family protein [Calditrichota bacterium]
MKDQAAQLRELVQDNGQSVASSPGSGQIHLVASGKGGVGKSVFALALAGAWARLGLRVLLVDADLASPSLHVLSGLDAPFTVQVMLKRGAERLNLDQLHLTENLWLLPGSHSGREQHLEQMADVHYFAEQLDQLAPRFDRLLIDTRTGVSRWNLGLFQYADCIYLLTQTEPTSVIETYLFVKAVRPYLDMRKLRLVVNQSLSEEGALEAHHHLNLALMHFLKTQLPLAAHLPFDPELREALVSQLPFWTEALSTTALDKIRQLANKESNAEQESVNVIPKNREVLP